MTAPDISWQPTLLDATVPPDVDPSFTGIDTTVRVDSAGRPAQTYGAVTGAGPARVLEFGLKLLF